MVDNPIDGYDDMTAQEVTDYLASNDLSNDELEAVRADEKDGKNRKTVLEAVDDNLEADDDAPTEDRDPSMSDRYWRAGEVPDSSDIPSVTVYKNETGGIAGYWWDEAGAKVVKRNRRVDDAIADGKLEIRGE